MNLVIGSTSQLAQYFPDDYVRISSRDVDFNYLKSNHWDSVYITFAEQRIYNQGIDYITPNYLYTLSIIESLLEGAKKIVCYTSCELWNELSGYISATTPPKFFPLTNEYTVSKMLLMNKITERRIVDLRYTKVRIFHPFYFNSIHRSDYFLFGKVFESIRTKRKIQLGCLNFYRDMVHAKFVVDKSIELQCDAVIGAGRLFHVEDFIKDLYTLNNMDFQEYVEIDCCIHSGKEKLIMAKVPWEYTYQNLLSDTQAELISWKQ